MIKKIGIISLGLIGSSILKRLYKKYDFYCYSTSSVNEKLSYTQNISNDLTIVKDCDLVFVCSPISKTSEILDKLNSILQKNTIVADVASVKSEFIDKKYNFNFIPTHPMAGSVEVGFSAGRDDLFEDAKWLVGCNNQDLNNIIIELGAKPYLIDMKLHDYMCAEISHAPAILAYMIFNNTIDSSKEIASSGFRDMTRLASSNPNLALDMLKYNRDNVFKVIDNLIEKLNNLKNLSYNKKIELFNKIASDRAQMYNEHGKNIFKNKKSN